MQERPRDRSQMHVCVCVYVCACVRERKGEGERPGDRSQLLGREVREPPVPAQNLRTRGREAQNLWSRGRQAQNPRREREFFIDNLLVRIHFIIVMIWWTGLAP